MLKSLELENFKCWAGRHRLEFGSITGLFGANSSGKSSIFQLLLLLKQTAESPDSKLLLHFGGEANAYVDLGSFLEIVHDHDVSSELSFTLDWLPDLEASFHSAFSVEEIAASNTITSLPGTRGEEVVNSRLSYNIDCHYSDPDMPEFIDGFSGNMSIASRNDSSGSYAAELTFEGDDVYFSNDIGDADAPIGLYGLDHRSVDNLAQRFDLYFDVLGASIPHLTTNQPQALVDLHKLDYLAYSDLCESYGIDLKGITNVDHDVARLLTKIGDITEQFLRKIVYLGPLRNHPHRTYPWTGVSPATVDHRGGQAMQVLLAERYASVDAVSNWLRRLGIAESFSLEQLGHDARTWEPLIRHQKESTEVNLADVGFGVSQVLPVIVALLSAPSGSLVILEHPDIHLHPRAQSDLADLLIDVASAGEIQILVESHSEHLLARIQRRIAESSRGDGGLKPEDVRLYFCEQDQGKSRLTPLEVQSSGVIKNWPRDFFGDMLAERMAMSGFYPKSDGRSTDG